MRKTSKTKPWLKKPIEIRALERLSGQKINIRNAEEYQQYLIKKSKKGLSLGEMRILNKGIKSGIVAEEVVTKILEHEPSALVKSRIKKALKNK